MESPQIAPRKEIVTSSGKHITIPPPVLWPQVALHTPQFKQWAKIGNHTQLKYVDAGKRTYVAEFCCIYKKAGDKTKTRYAKIFNVTRYRPDGTREVTTEYGVGSSPSKWTYYSKDGQSPVIAVNQSITVGFGPYLSRVILFDDKGGSHIFNISHTGVVWSPDHS